MLFEVTEGWSAEMGPFTLRVLQNGVMTPLNLTGLRVTLHARDLNGKVVPMQGSVRQAPQNGATVGQVFYTPAPTDFVALAFPYTPYKTHWQVSDVNNAAISFPNGEPDDIRVWPL